MWICAGWIKLDDCSLQFEIIMTLWILKWWFNFLRNYSMKFRLIKEDDLSLRWIRVHVLLFIMIAISCIDGSLSLGARHPWASQIVLHYCQCLCFILSIQSFSNFPHFDKWSPAPVSLCSFHWVTHLTEVYYYCLHYSGIIILALG